jgi:hypothetical protein
MPAAVSGQVRGMTPPGSVIPRVTPTATDHGPDHHRTEGSLTVIPPGPTAANQTALNGMPSQPELPRALLERSERKMGSYLLNSGGQERASAATTRMRPGWDEAPEHGTSPAMPASELQNAGSPSGRSAITNSDAGTQRVHTLPQPDRSGCRRTPVLNGSPDRIRTGATALRGTRRSPMQRPADLQRCRQPGRARPGCGHAWAYTPRPSADALVPTSHRARPSGGRPETAHGAREGPQRPRSGCRRRRSEPASRHRTYGANPLSIQVRKRWTLSAGHGP